MEDLEQNGGPSRPRPPPTTSDPASRRPLTPPPDPKEERRKKFKKHDPYRLPETEMPTVSTEDKPDARLATEDELKQFIDDVHPEDIDIESPEFTALPTEVQYEIVGDMRVRSRQTSHRRLTDMLRAAPSALDFSMAQIKNLSQRNALTQQLLTVTDMVGQAHLTIPVRIAAERNREYVLVKRDEASGGGWALGIREGSKQKPIEVEDDKPTKADDGDSDYSDSGYDSSDVEEIAPPAPPSRQTTDPDLKEHRRREVLEAIAARYAPKKAARPSLDIEPKEFGKAKAPGAVPLFEPADEDDDDEAVVPSANDEALALALQQEELGSDEDEADSDLATALAMSRREAEQRDRAVSVDQARSETSEDSFEEVSIEPSRVPTPQNLSEQPTPVPADVQESDSDDDLIEVDGSLAPFTLSSKSTSQRPGLTLRESGGLIPPPPAEQRQPSNRQSEKTDVIVADQSGHTVNSVNALNEVDRRLENEAKKESPRKPAPASAFKPVELPRKERSTIPEVTESAVHSTLDEEDDDIVEIEPPKPSLTEAAVRDLPSDSKHTASISKPVPPKTTPVVTADQRPQTTLIANNRQADKPTPPIKPILSRQFSRVSSHVASPAPASGSRASSIRSISRTPAREAAPEDPDNLTDALLGVRPDRPIDRHSYMEMAEESVPSSYHGSANGDKDIESDDEREKDEDDEDEDQIAWSRSPSPVSRPPLQPAQSGETIPSEVEDGDEDMAPAEMVSEQDDYARFMASIRNRDLNEVRTEIDDEIRVLHNQNKLAMRDSDEITHSMIAQIQV